MDSTHLYKKPCIETTNGVEFDNDLKVGFLEQRPKLTGIWALSSESEKKISSLNSNMQRNNISIPSEYKNSQGKYPFIKKTLKLETVFRFIYFYMIFLYSENTGDYQTA